MRQNLSFRTFFFSGWRSISTFALVPLFLSIFLVHIALLYLHSLYFNRYLGLRESLIPCHVVYLLGFEVMNNL